MPYREVSHAINDSTIRFAKTNRTDWSNQQTFTVATDPTTPAAPTIAAAAADQAIDLTLTPPSLNDDGVTTVDDLQSGEFTIYYAPEFLCLGSLPSLHV